VQLAIDQQTIASLVVNDKSVADLTALEIGNIGENIAVRRAMYLRAANDKQLIASYVHSTGMFIVCRHGVHKHYTVRQKNCTILFLQ